MDMIKRASAAAVRRVSFQSKAPAPRMTRTILARRTIKRAVTGKDQNMMCLAEMAISIRNSSRLPLENNLDKVGKAAEEYETPMIVSGTDWRLLAKLKIEIEPPAMSEAKAIRKNEAS